MITRFSPPAGNTELVTPNQLVEFNARFCCKPQAVGDPVQATTAVFVPVRKIRRNGAPGVCTANRDQNPPVSE